MSANGEESVNTVYRLPFHGELPVRYLLVFNLWNSTMIPDIEEFRAG